MVPRTAAVIIIGNEILSGKVRDENAHFLAEELRALGVNLCRIAVIPDIVEEIAATVASCSRKYDYVFTSGGVGPTHDDVTMRGVAAAFGLDTVMNERYRQAIIERCGMQTSEVALRMAELPRGAEVIELNGINFPPVRVENVYVFPGIPEFLRKKFLALKERFRGEPYHLRRIYLNGEECLIAESLDAVARKFPMVEIGSYPKIGEKRYSILVTLESTSEGSLAEAVEELLKLLPGDIVVSTA
ncbi:MAG: molybdopterin-binding protein [Nitrospiraceae bacterium]|nr:molybdopterin-binding protein [Nitrospiraceae bacterium]